MLNIFNRAVEKKPETGNRILAEVPQAVSEAVLFATMESIAKTIRLDPQTLAKLQKAQADWCSLRSELEKFSPRNVSTAHQSQSASIARAVSEGKPLPDVQSLDFIRDTFRQKRVAFFDAMNCVTVASFPAVKTILAQFIGELDELAGDRIRRRDLDIDQDTLQIVREFVQRRLDFCDKPAHPHTSPASLLQGVVKL